jgi:MFS family permease
MLPPLIFLAIDKPEDVNEKPDGIQKKIVNKNTKIFGLSLNQALKEKSFYILSFSFFSISTLVTALHFFQVTILNQYFNLPSREAAALFIPTMITMIIFIPLAGKILDKFETHNVIGIALLVTTASLISISFSSNITFAIIYSIIFGINNAFNLSLFGYIWPRYFGRLHVGSIQGTGQMVLVVGASIGAMPFALAMDFGFDLLLTIRLAALYPFLSAFLCFFFLRESQKLTDMRNLQ